MGKTPVTPSGWGQAFIFTVTGHLQGKAWCCNSSLSVKPNILNLVSYLSYRATI